MTLDGLTFTANGGVTFGRAATDQVTLSNGAVTITTSSNDVTFEAEVGGAQALTVNAGTGTTRFNAAVGDTIPLFSLTTAAGGRTEIGNSISTSGGTQTYNDPVGLTGPSALTDTGATGIIFSSTLDGAQDLTLNVTGGTSFNGAVGSTTPLGDGVGSALTINSAGTTAFASTLATASGISQAGGAGALTFRGDVTVGAGDTPTMLLADVTLDGLTFTANGGVTFGIASTDQVTLSNGPVTVATSDADVTFEAKVDGAHALAVNAGTGTTRINADVGSATPLLSLTTDAGGQTEIGASITTTGGTQTYNDAVDLTGSTTLTDTGGTGVAFKSTVDGAHDLTLNVTGPTTFVGAVGSTTPIGDGSGPSITINSPGPTAFGDAVETADGIFQAEDAGPVIFPGGGGPAPGPGGPGPELDPNPVLPEVENEEVVQGLDPVVGAATLVDLQGPRDRPIRGDDIVAFLECARLEGDPAQVPMGCPSAYARFAAIPQEGGLPPVAAGRGAPAALRTDRLVVLAPSIGDAGRPPSPGELEALRIYRKLEREDARGMIARAVEAYKSETGVREVKGVELRLYVERSPSQSQSAAYLNATHDLLTQLSRAGMETLDLERASLRILEQISPGNLPARELEAAALSPSP